MKISCFFNCLLIGEGSLLIQCAEILIQKKHQIIGILSSDREVVDWTKANNIPCLQNSQQLEKALSQSHCNYIFNIFNNYNIEPEILEIAEQVIDFQNGVAPVFSGENATSWAIINGAKQHTIAWVQAHQIDNHPISKQVTISIEDVETALTLNTKSYQAAINSFKELIEVLATKKVSQKNQYTTQKLSSFTQQLRLSRFGIIDFADSAIEIDRLVRGLDFGNHNNSLGTAKLLLNSAKKSDYVVVKKVEILTTSSSQLPGTIVEINKNQLIVATKTQDIALKTIVDRRKQNYLISDLVQNYQLKIGQKLPELKNEAIANIVRSDSNIALSEQYWLKQLTNSKPLTLPFKLIPTASKNISLYQKIKLPFSQTVTNFVGKSSNAIIAAFAIYLARLNNNNYLSFGLEQHDQEPWFAKYVPLNLEIKLEKNFASILQNVANTLELNQKHQTYGTDIILRYPQLANHNNFFSVVISQNKKNAEENNLPNSDLILIIDQQKEEYFWYYNTQVFSAATIERMLEKWVILWDNIANNPQSPINQLSLVSPSERHLILKDWNQTTTDYPHDKCLHQLFETQVAKQPEAIAIAYQGQSLTYRELNQKANQLAHHLQDLGVKAETLVGICVERSLEMVIGLFAILKAGGAYLPLDPNYPQTRLTYLLKDAQVDILLTQAKLLDRLPATSAKVLCLDRESEVISQKENPVSNVNSSNLAYVIYTSGSTGKPKGVAIEHHSVVNTLHDLEKRFQIKAQDRILAVSSLSFDLSVYDIFGVLGSGGTVIIPQAENCPNPEHWLDLIDKEGVTIWNSAPALMELLVNYMMTNDCQVPPSLRLILLSGDRISPSLVTQLQTLNPQLQIISLGGATEASIWSICYPINNLPASAKTIPYGRPLNNQYFYILDQKLQLVPIGMIGELYIGGVGIARGYLNREELTNTKFILDPFVSPSHPDHSSLSRCTLIYKTGDLGRYLEDGNIEFLGRIDNQVKIAGVRVELGEIETALLQYPAVREGIVAIADSSSEQKSLVAYCVLKSQATATSSQLRDFLKTQLPAYAIPSLFVFLESLPLTPNGKLDRQALPKAQINTLETNNNFLPPQDSLEWQLSQIWSKILNVQPIGRNDNFFELGGNSLSALRLFEQIQTIFGKKLPLATLFQTPTIAQLAKLIANQGWSASWSSLVSIQPHGEQSPFFCIHAVGGNVLSYQQLAQALGTERPFYGLQARGLDGQQTPLTSVEEIAASYLEEIKLIQPKGPYFLGGHSFGGFVAFEIAQQLSRQGETVAVLALLDCLGPNCFEKYTLSQWLSIHLSNLAQLPTSKKLTYVRGRVEFILQSKIPWSWQKKYFQLADLRLSPEQRLISKIEKINFQALQKYRPTVYSGKLTIFRAQIKQARGYFDPYAGWNCLASGGIDVHEIPGDHKSFLIQPENAQILAEKLKAILADFRELPLNV